MKETYLKNMSNQITITLPDDVYQKAEHFARLANRDLASILVDTIQFSIPPISLEATTLEPVSALSDQQVLALTELQMESEEDIRLSELLDKQQAGIVTESEHSELQTLMRKATALSEAVKRGLIKELGA